MNETIDAATQLANRWATLREEQPKLRIRDAATALDTSEAELLATEVGGDVRRLRCEPKTMLLEMPKLGHVMVLTRNEAFVHEREGTFEDVSMEGHVGLVLGPDIDLRLFLHAWKSAYAVRKETPRGVLESIQFFDGQGTAVFKVYLREQSNRDAYEAIVQEYLHEDQSVGQDVTAARPAPEEKPDSEIDVDGFQAAWLGMKDTHEFFGMMRKFGVTRTQALRLAPEGHADKLDVEVFQKLLEGAAAGEVPIMVFVGNPGCIQIHSGPVERLKLLGDWFNVLDPMFNLHVKLPLLESAWRVRKPTEDGMVTSLELFDADGTNLAMLFGARKPGVPERTDWRELVESL